VEAELGLSEANSGRGMSNIMGRKPPLPERLGSINRSGNGSLTGAIASF